MSEPAKNIINQGWSDAGDYSSQSGTITPAPAFTSETTITTDLYAAGVNDFNRTTVSFKLYKLGTVVFMIMKPMIKEIPDIQWFGRADVIPEAYRPTSIMLQPISPIRGLSNGMYEVQSDITGACYAFPHGNLEFGVSLIREPAVGVVRTAVGSASQ
jgi:hypothetical protein